MFKIRIEPVWAIAGIILFAVCSVLYFITGLSSIERDKLENSKK